MSMTDRMKNYQTEERAEFLNKAESLRPKLIKGTVYPKKITTDGRERETKLLLKMRFNKGKSLCLDFGTHCVGYLSFEIKPDGYPPDAPAYLRIKLAERMSELEYNSTDYNGALSSGWIQEEYLHVDVMPALIRLPRRYAFRYVQIYVIDTSPSYDVRLSGFECETVTSADMAEVPPVLCRDERLLQIDRISVKTLSECMQDVFEDGPKRDRRLWIGDLRLQALVNYCTFKNYDLVKRCLYLFAGSVLSGGCVGACMYAEPAAKVGAVKLFDYSLFFISCLYDYYTETKDRELLNELYPTALKQAELAAERLEENYIVRDSGDWWCFLDWNDALNKQAGAQAVFIYTLKHLRILTAELGRDCEFIDSMIRQLSEAAKNSFWDAEQGFFVSGKERQVSWAAQVWFVLADILTEKENAELLMRLMKQNPDIRMVTPYMYHYFVEALIKAGMKKEARRCICEYWGSMADDGADCFFELYDPEDKKLSPYGSAAVNSYCHAWSCTPAYFIRKFFAE